MNLNKEIPSLFVFDFHPDFFQQEIALQQPLFNLLEALHVFGPKLPHRLQRLSGTRGLHHARFPLGHRQCDCFLLLDGQRMVMVHHEIREKQQPMLKKSIQKALSAQHQLLQKHPSTKLQSWPDYKKQLYLAHPAQSKRLEREAFAYLVGQQIKSARRNSLLTQSALGERIGKNRAYIAQIESHGANMTLKTLYELVCFGLGGEIQMPLLHLER